MTRKSLSLAILLALLLPVGVSWAQLAMEPASAPAGMTVHDSYGPSMFQIIVACGPIGILIWLGIFSWAIALLPLGILSIVHCSNTRVHQLPLTTKLLIYGIVWLFVLGLFGVAHGGMFAFSTLACTAAGAAQQAMLAINIAEALYSIAAALSVVQMYLLFLTISIMVVHFRHRKILTQTSSPV